MSASGELFARLAEDRLRERARWAALVLVAGVAIPYEVIENQPHFVWSLFGELPPAALVAALAPSATGLTILLVRRLCRRPSSFAIAVTAALVTAALVHRIGAEAAAWGVLPLPRSFSLRAPLALLTLALTGAGANLAYRRETRRASRAMLVAAVLVAFVFYGSPGRGEAPGATVLRTWSVVGAMPTIHFQLGAATIATIASWPAIIALVGLVHLKRPPSRALSVLGMVALFGFPLILLMLLLVSFTRGGGGAGLFGALGAAAQIAAVLALLAGAFEVLGEAAAPKEAEPGADAAEAESAIEEEAHRARARMQGLSPRTATAVALGVVGALCSAQAWLARPPRKGVEWTLAPPSAPADLLFERHVTRWSDARWAWHSRVSRQSGAEALIEVKARSHELVDAARGIDGPLAERLAALTSAAHRLDVSARRWFRLVADANQACRDARLPYYLDPFVALRTTKEGIGRLLFVDSYRVDRVRQFRGGGAQLTALHVRGFGQLRAGHRLGLLGFSRDLQPFALVVVDSIEGHVASLRQKAAIDPPRCGQGYDAGHDEATRQCGKVVAGLARRLGNGLAAAETHNTERHELQHQLDGPLLRLAAPVLRKLGAYTDEARERVNRELSAYLAEVAGSFGSPGLALITPFEHAVLSDRGTYHHAAVLLMEALAERKLRSFGQEVDLPAMTRAFAELCALDEEALRGRARDAWRELYGTDLARVEATGESVGPP